MRVTNPLLPGRPLPAHKHKAPKHKKAKKPVKRKLALGEGVACCAAEALAASLRLAGYSVPDEDVLALYWRTAAHADAGATILATLEAAREHGLGAFQLASFRPAECDWNLLAGSSGIGQAVHHFIQGAAGDRKVTQQGEPFRLGPVHPASVILGVTLPGGPHALTLDPSGAVWSWGELYDPGDLEIEEAWLVDWDLEDRGQLAQVRVQDIPGDVMLRDLP